MAQLASQSRLQLMPRRLYTALPERDPLRFYFWPFLGRMYRRRVELCLAECLPGQRVLEVGFGSGLTFLNLAELYDEIHGIDLTAPVEKVTDLFHTQGVNVHLRNGDVLNLPYPDNYFDTVLLISILEHIKPEEQDQACREIARVLKPGGQMVYGVPVERPLMVCMFRLLGYNIREHHFSTQDQVWAAAGRVMEKVRLVPMRGVPRWLGSVYEVGHFRNQVY